MNIWRINLKSASRNNVNPRQFCLEKNIVGVGWRINEETKTLTWNQYHSQASKIYGDKSWKAALNAIKNRIKINDLIWTSLWMITALIFWTKLKKTTPKI